MKPSDISALINMAIDRDLNLLTTGEPGVGKTAVIQQTIAARNVEQGDKLQLIEFRMSMHEPFDLYGLPTVDRTPAGPVMARAVPSWLPRDPESRGVIFLDELLHGNASMQAAGLSLIHERRIEDYTLPAGWRIIAASNRESDRAGVHRMISPMRSRFLHVHFEPDVNDWQRWALANGVRTEVVAYLSWKPAHLTMFDPQSKEDNYACPRTWEFASRVLDGALPTHVELEAMRGTLGEAVAAEFVGFVRIFRNLPNPDAVLADPNGAEVPSDPATLFALLGALAHRSKVDNFDRVLQYGARVPADFSVSLVTQAVRRDKALQSSRAFIEWASKNADVYL